MPTTNCGFDHEYDLALHGPTLSVEVGFDADFRVAPGNRPVLQSGLLPALVDTGAAERSCVITP